ncbi:MAG: nucleotidyltransferase family protein, partial [Poseidonia sp.]
GSMGPLPVAAVVLAAGLSRRLGRPKALVSINELTLVEWAHQRLNEAGCETVVVVNNDLAEEVARLLPEATLVVNDDPDAGRMRSLQLGCAALVDQRGTLPERLVIAPVDRPAWNTATLQGLLNASTSSAPAHEGRRGHPVLLDQPAIEAVVSANADASLRALVSFAPVPVEAPWLHHNIDTKADVDRLLADEAACLACFSRGEGI